MNIDLVFCWVERKAVFSHHFFLVAAVYEVLALCQALLPAQQLRGLDCLGGNLLWTMPSPCTSPSLSLLSVKWSNECPPHPAASFTIAKIWKRPKWPSIDEWIKKLWYIYTMECYLAVKKNEICPGWYSSVDWARACQPKGCQFDS